VRLKQILHAALVNLARLLRRMSLVIFRLADRSTNGDEDSLRQLVRSTRYDMVHAADEPYYLAQYLEVLSPFLSGISPKPLIVDLGCGQGRFLFALKDVFPDGSLHGCDISDPALQTARELQTKYGGEPVTFVEADIRDYIETWDTGSIDLCLMTEVSFFMPDWQDVAKKTVKKIRSGGLVAMSFRPQYFNGLIAVRNKEFEFLQTICDKRSGNFDPASQLQYSWQTSKELADVFSIELDMEILALTGIGIASGIPGDPHSSIARPSSLSEKQRRMLMEFELEMGSTHPDTGRYIFVIAKKNLPRSSSDLTLKVDERG
jgi:SAM-dependent methyltransferase